jgi:hypothetical protein
MRKIGSYRYQGDRQSLIERAYKEDLVRELIMRQPVPDLPPKRS